MFKKQHLNGVRNLGVMWMCSIYDYSLKTNQ